MLGQAEQVTRSDLRSEGCGLHVSYHFPYLTSLRAAAARLLLHLLLFECPLPSRVRSTRNTTPFIGMSHPCRAQPSSITFGLLEGVVCVPPSLFRAHVRSPDCGGKSQSYCLCILPQLTHVSVMYHPLVSLLNYFFLFSSPKP